MLDALARQPGGQRLCFYCSPENASLSRVYVGLCMYVRTYVCMYVCTYIGMYLCIYVCMYVRMYVHIIKRMHVYGYS